MFVRMTPDDLAEAQCDNRQIVTAKTQCRDANQNTEDTGNHCTDQQRQKDIGNSGTCITGFQKFLHRNGLHENAACVCTDRHKACMSKRQLAQIAGLQRSMKSQE